MTGQTAALVGAKRTAGMTDQRKTIAVGFQVERPHVLLPWGASLVQVRDLLGTSTVSFQDAIVDAKCTALDGLECGLLLHGSRGYGQTAMRDRLTMISFWKQGDPLGIFTEIQRHLESTFGPPHETIVGHGDSPAEHKWVIGDVVIGHYIDDRGGPQQRTSIRKM